MARRTDISLTPDAIVDAACALLDRVGLEGMTMRALAAALDVEAPALYAHIGSKDALFGMMVSRLYWRAREGLDHCASASAFLIALGARLQDTLNATRDAPRLFAMSSVPSRVDSAEAERAIAPLVRLGISEHAALEIHSGVMALSLGWALYRLNEPIADFLDARIDVSRAFEHSLAQLVAGFMATYDHNEA